MKKKLLLFLAILSALICALTISVSATVPDWTETKDLGFAEKTTTDKSTTFDTTSRVMLLDGDTYVTYPTYYIIKGTDTTFTTSSELDFSALNTATEKNFSYASIIKLEVPYGYTISDERAFRTDKGFTSMVYIKLPDSMTTI